MEETLQFILQRLLHLVESHVQANEQRLYEPHQGLW
jgi:hypothetical protein